MTEQKTTGAQRQRLRLMRKAERNREFYKDTPALKPSRQVKRRPQIEARKRG